MRDTRRGLANREIRGVHRKGISLMGLAAVLALSFMPGRSLAAESDVTQSGHFKDNNLKGNYLCNLDGDDSFENSIILLAADGKGNLSANKVHVSIDFTGTGCGSTACVCAFTGTATTSVKSDGTGLTTWSWSPSGGNPGPCPSAQDDTWAFALASGGKSFFVASANSGFTAEPAIGGCSSAP